VNAVVVAAFVLAGVTANAADELEFRIRQADYDGQKPGCYVSGTRIPIQLEFANEGDDRVSVTIVDHDRNGNQQRYPDGLQIRVIDAKGQVLTAHGLNLGDNNREWWTSQYLSSTLVTEDEREMPGHEIVLEPGASVRRVYDVATVAGGCRSCPVSFWEFTPGKYFVELRLNGLRSNQFEIAVLEQGETCE